jgi:starch synthase
MYSMRYGTVPIVRATGGLDDTVTDYNPQAGTGTGFKFRDYTSDALLETLERARATFGNPNIWRQLQLAGMRQDFSWDRSAREYVKLYERALGAPDPAVGQRPPQPRGAVGITGDTNGIGKNPDFHRRQF